MDVAFRKVFNVGELQVQLRQPHQHAFPGAFKVLPLAREILRGRVTGGVVVELKISMFILKNPSLT